MAKAACLDERALKTPPGIKGLDFGDKEIRAARQDGRLLMVSTFTSAACNLKCRYCYAEAGKALADELTLDEYKDVISEAKALGARTVWIPGAGEPTMQPDFLELLDFIYRLGLTLVIFTNGTQITKELAAELFGKGASVITKCNSLKAEIQDDLAGRAGSFIKIQQGLRNLMEAGFTDSYPTRLGIESVICRQNYDELHEIFIWARKNNVYPYFEMMMNSGRAVGNDDLRLSIDEEKQLFYKLLKVDQEQFGFTWLPVPPYVASKCNKLFYNITINSQGYAQPCCGVKMPIANVRTTPLSKIMKKSLAKKSRFMDRYVEGNCGSCKIEGCYYGCRSEAYACGNFFGSYERCWHNPPVNPEGKDNSSQT